MTKNILTVVFAMLLMAAAVAVPSGYIEIAYAQGTAVMPTLYNQSGVPVNTTANSSLPAGWYYTAPNGAAGNQVYYYGNGTYYNPTTMTYGGSVSDPSGLSGVVLNYSTAVQNTPGLPNTGFGGEAAAVWAVLILSGIVVIAGSAYLISNYNGSRTA